MLLVFNKTEKRWSRNKEEKVVGFSHKEKQNKLDKLLKLLEERIGIKIWDHKIREIIQKKGRESVKKKEMKREKERNEREIICEKIKEEQMREK